MKRLLLGGVVAVLLSGCGQKDSVVIKDGEKTEPKAAVAAKIPDELMTEGAQYYLGKLDEPVKIRMTVEGQKPKVGNFVYKLTDAALGKVQVERDGDLTELGSDTMELRKDGVYCLSNTVVEFSKPQLELQSNPAPGNTWDSKAQVKIQSSDFEMTSNYKVIGKEKLKTEVGELDTIVVKADSLLIGDTVRIEIAAKTWFAKGKGMVRQESTIKQPGKTTKQVHELVK